VRAQGWKGGYDGERKGGEVGIWWEGGRYDVLRCKEEDKSIFYETFGRC